MAKTWADRHGRRIVALTVDHRLRPEGAHWAMGCAARAARLGLQHRTLVWEGPKPAAGVAAAARQARHRLLAEAAREAGAGVILMGHTADDLAEAARMRRAGSTVPSPRTWSPSPVWPEGRGIFILRPLLGVRRARLRDMLLDAGETWIEDPANMDPASARARARRDLAVEDWVPLPAPCLAAGGLDDLAWGPAGDLTLPRGRLVADADPEGLLGAAVLCAAGTGRPPRRERLARLLGKIASREAFASTLAGARIWIRGEMIAMARDVADRRHGEIEVLDLPEGRAVVWDGRFELRASAPGLRVTALAGHAARLAPDLRRLVRAVPPKSRPALPRVAFPDGRFACPTLAADPGVEIHKLAPDRMEAARGVIVNEATLRRMAKSAVPP